MSNGKVIAIVGDTGAGKTTYVKNFSARCKRKEIICYLRIRTDLEDQKIIKYTNFEEFLNVASKKKNTLFLIDEAFTCMPKKLNVKMNKPNDMNNKLVDFLVNSRKMNNFVFIIFHSLSQIPTEWLIPYLNYIVRFKTQDLLQYQVSRFKSFPQIHSNLIEVPTVADYKPITLKLR